MAEFLSDVGKDINYGVDYAVNKVSHPGETFGELKGTGRRAVNYVSDRATHPSKALYDVENIATRFMDDIVNNNTHKLLLYAGVLYFILSFQGFKNTFDNVVRSIPLVKTIYLFPHVANTALFVLLLYIIKYKIDDDIVRGIRSTSNWIKKHSP